MTTRTEVPLALTVVNTEAVGELAPPGAVEEDSSPLEGSTSIGVTGPRSVRCRTLTSFVFSNASGGAPPSNAAVDPDRNLPDINRVMSKNMGKAIVK